MKKKLILALLLPLSATFSSCATSEVYSEPSEENTSEVSSQEISETTSSENSVVTSNEVSSVITSESSSEISSLVSSEEISSSSSSNEEVKGYYYFGRYPQTIKSNDVNILESKGDNLYLGSDGEEYVSLSASPYSDSYIFSDGTPVTNSTLYYFKVEPICWKVLQTNEESMLLNTSFIIDTHQYYHSRDNREIGGKTIYPSNYEYSDIRAWINDTFYNNAFLQEEKLRIQTTHVDNSASTTTEPANQYCCSDTEDKVFLLSAKEACNEEYGYGQEEAANRVKALTDYAIARGGFYSSPENKGIYLLRSPSNMMEMCSTVMLPQAYMNITSYVDSTFTGVAPAIKISL